MNFFGKNLTTLRKDKGVSQGEAAELVGVKGHTWSDYERGRSEPNLDTLIKISDLFRVDLNKLLKEQIIIVQVTDDSDTTKKHEKSTDNCTGNCTDKEEVLSKIEEPTPTYLTQKSEDLTRALTLVIETQKDLISALNSNNLMLKKRVEELEKTGEK